VHLCVSGTHLPNAFVEVKTVGNEQLAADGAHGQIGRPLQSVNSYLVEFLARRRPRVEHPYAVGQLVDDEDQVVEYRHVDDCNAIRRLVNFALPRSSI